MKKKLKSQLFLALMMLIITAVGLVSSSQAWFTSKLSTGQNISLYAKASEGIMLCAYRASDAPDVSNNLDWKSAISQADIFADGGPQTGPNWGLQSDAFPTEMLNVSSLANATSHAFYSATHNDMGELQGYVAKSQPGNYSKFSLWIKSTKTGYIYLDSSSIVNGNEISEPGHSICKTVRVAFVPVATGGDEQWSEATIWEPNSKTHIAEVYSGVPQADGKVVTNAVKGTSISDTATQTTYDFSDGDTNVLANGSYGGGKVSAGLNDPTKIALFNLVNDVAKNFNVYIWVEGADVDTVNAIAENYFTVFFKVSQKVDEIM